MTVAEKQPVKPKMVGKRLRQILKRRGMTAWQAAVHFGVSEQAVRNWLNDTNGMHSDRIPVLEGLERGS
jgi:transcriptional regulator with XRE-family HTH domain